MDPRTLEELALNAWPPLELSLYDGWLLTFSNGYTRRANSIHPLYPSARPPEEKIATCEQIYASRNLGTVFKLTSSPEDQALDEELAARGYEQIALTSVQTAAITNPQRDYTVRIDTTLTEQWLADFNRLSVTPERFHAAMRQVLEKIAPPHAFAATDVSRETVAMGLAVAERGYVGLFDIVVDSRHRNQGLALRLISTLLHWATTQAQAQTAHLAVMADNAPAQHLYAKLGFREQYRYWYRYKPTAQ